MDTLPPVLTKFIDVRKNLQNLLRIKIDFDTLDEFQNYLKLGQTSTGILSQNIQILELVLNFKELDDDIDEETVKGIV